MYFVPEEDAVSKVWDILGQPPGYISTYREEAEKLNETELDNLHGALETLFSYCQCLPNSKREGQSTVWEVRKGEVILLGNPLFYKLDSIGDGGKQRNNRRAPTHSGTVSIKRGLLQLTGLSKSQASRTLRYADTLKRTEAKRKKSSRTRNRRIPPTAQKKKKPVSDEDEYQGSEEDEGSDISLCGESEQSDVTLDESGDSFD
jgi:hypothetical protein